jgi:hypothetical protein
MASRLGKLYVTYFVQFTDGGWQVKTLAREDKPWWFRNSYEDYDPRIRTARRLQTNGGLTFTLPVVVRFATIKFEKHTSFSSAG